MRKYILKTYLSLLLVVIITLSLYHSPTQGSLVDIEPVWENINKSGGEVYFQDEYIVVTSNLKCFDKDTGDIIWDEVKYNGEVVKYIKGVFDVDNGVIIALYSTNTVLGISVLDGNVLWSYPF
jgi:outer membrane protein assembly factor BamB